MFPLNYNENAPISPIDPFSGEIYSSNCFSTIANYAHQEEVLLQQYQNLLLYGQQSLKAYAANTEQKDANCREQVAQGSNKKTTKIAEKQILKKKPAKKDRHSKIYTAQGPRDRRMRMSLEVAKPFFALQDMLGFNKGSKTIEWLLTQARDAIIKVAGGDFPHWNQSCNNEITSKSASSISESCEVMSRNNDSRQQKETSIVTEEKSIASFKKVKKKAKQLRKSTCQQVGKEARKKARERARERTKKKMKSRQLNELNNSCNEVVVNQEWHQVGSSCSPFESADRSHNTFEEVMLAEAEIEPCCSKQVEDMDKDLFLIMGNWSPSLVFNYRQNN